MVDKLRKLLMAISLAMMAALSLSPDCLAQIPPTATSPLTGTETVTCVQNGSPRGCTPVMIVAGGSGLSMAVGQGSISLISAGAGYAVGDNITLSSPCASFSTAPILVVNAVSSGAIAGVTLQNGGLTNAAYGTSCSFAQASTTGSGTGASFSGKLGVVAASFSASTLGTGGGAANGSLWIGAETPSALGSVATESTYFGDKAGGGFVGTASYNTAFGHDACGKYWTDLSGATAPTGSGNTCVGVDAGRDINGSAYNDTLIGLNTGRYISGGADTYVGYGAGQLTTSGGGNTAVGDQALYSLTTGGFNVAIGFQALFSASTTYHNIALGYQALYADTSGDFNTAAGFSALANTTTGGGNSAFGAGSLQANTTGANNAAFGQNALQAATTASGNSAFGFAALNVATGQYNTAVGSSSALSLTSGQYNSSVGFFSLGSLTTGTNNAAVGVNALFNVTTASYNAAFGDNAGFKVTTGSNNVLIGPEVATTTLTTGNFNILIGISSATDTVTSSTNSEINIGKAIVGYSIVPTVTSGLGTSPTVSGNGTFAFKITAGTSSPSTTEVLGMPQAPTDWVCFASDRTSNITARQTASSATSVTFTWSAAPTAGDVIQHVCQAY